MFEFGDASRPQCLRFWLLPESSEVAILKFAFDHSLGVIIPYGLCVSDQMVRACALRDCLDVSRPFLSETSPKCIDREALGRRRTGKIHTRNKFSFCVTRPVTNGNAVDHIDRIQLPKVSSGSVKNMALVGLFNLAGSQTLFSYVHQLAFFLRVDLRQPFLFFFKRNK